MWRERFAGFNQRLEAGEDARPAIRSRSVATIVLSQLVMRHRDLGGLGLRHEFYRDAGELARWAESKRVLQQPWRLSLEHLAANIGRAFAIGPVPTQFIEPLRAISGTAISSRATPSEKPLRWIMSLAHLNITLYKSNNLQPPRRLNGLTFDPKCRDAR